MQNTPKNVVLLPHTAVGEAVRRAAKARLYRKLGYNVYVSSTSQLKSNPEAFELLFQKNPYIAGAKTPDPDDLIDGIVAEKDPFRRNTFDPGILRQPDFSEEERQIQIHYLPKRMPGLEETTILDLNISSYRLDERRDSFSNVAAYVRKHYPGALAILRSDYDLEEREFGPLPVAAEFDSIDFGTIYDYCDIASSCKKMICLQTGSLPIACYYNRTVDCLRTEGFRADPTDRNRLLFIDCDFADIDVR